MKKGVKITLIVAGSVLALVAVGYFVMTFLMSKDKLNSNGNDNSKITG